MFSFFRKKRPNERPRAIAFIDYEHWYISYDKLLRQKPDIKKWRDLLAETYDVREMLFFADFSNDSLRQEISRIREVSSSIIETQNTSSRFKKDFTDFIMLDHIYQRAFSAQDVDVFLIFSGDGHFSSVVSFLINRCGKTVGVYGVRDAMSQQLKNTASFFVEIPELDLGDRTYYPMILGNLKELEEKQNDPAHPQYPTFWGTVDAVSCRTHAAKREIADALRRLIDFGYIYQTEKQIASRAAASKTRAQQEKKNTPNTKNTSGKKTSDAQTAAQPAKQTSGKGRGTDSTAAPKKQTKAVPETVNIKILNVDWKKVRRDDLLASAGK